MNSNDAPRTEDNPRVLLPIPEVQAALGGISRAALYQEITSGRLRVTRIGRRVFVRRTALDDYIDKLDQDDV